MNSCNPCFRYTWQHPWLSCKISTVNSVDIGDGLRPYTHLVSATSLSFLSLNFFAHVFLNTHRLKYGTTIQPDSILGLDLLKSISSIHNSHRPDRVRECLSLSFLFYGRFSVGSKFWAIVTWSIRLGIMPIIERLLRGPALNLSECQLFSK